MYIHILSRQLAVRHVRVAGGGGDACVRVRGENLAAVLTEINADKKTVVNQGGGIKAKWRIYPRPKQKDLPVGTSAGSARCAGAIYGHSASTSLPHRGVKRPQRFGLSR